MNKPLSDRELLAFAAHSAKAAIAAAPTSKQGGE